MFKSKLKIGDKIEVKKFKRNFLLLMLGIMGKKGTIIDINTGLENENIYTIEMDESFLFGSDGANHSIKTTIRGKDGYCINLFEKDIKKIKSTKEVK